MFSRLILSFALLVPSWAGAAPVPPITIRLDIRNLTGPGDEGARSAGDLARPLAGINAIWSRCAIRFTLREAVNVSAERLRIPYRPEGQADLGRIAAALNPEGFAAADALPVTYAGRWGFFDSGMGVYPTGLGWVFVNGDGTLNRIGAMVDATKTQGELAPAIIGHEIGHALSLPETGVAGNLMGGGIPPDLTDEQCSRARSFAGTALARFVDSSTTVASRREP